MTDSKLEQQVEQYSKLAKDKNVDVAALMLNALQNDQNNLIKPSTKRWAYLISLGVPPLGLLFALYFYASNYDDGKAAATMCLILTAISIVGGIIFLKVFFSTSGTSLQQIQQIKPQDIQQLTE
jgi:hypothetical protein